MQWYKIRKAENTHAYIHLKKNLIRLVGLVQS